MVKISITTSRRTEWVPVTRAIQRALEGVPAWDGLLHVHSPHTTAGVTVNEQADPDVAADMEKAFARLIPWNAGYAHAEGNSAAHIQTALVGTSVLVPVKAGRPAMGTWQGIFLCEFDGPRTRELWLTPVKEA
ncbi:MAG TPA: secondary thiamine-phosphate synthase enzyme YjbQ [Kiritimatiellia bacterium]|nr:secondary thiamine-phosphate synthase enzyme YjbQ [Kiritimatiellia bacterium]HPJ57775.1 secondary thiamine-phosphate synthase enzyme YjbQ [Kiritimatiellia bacterium]HRX06981.1 secondary thiamine-phosphate synthase enzyme YjbQ [Kiritimatiellia bacterium]